MRHARRSRCLALLLALLASTALAQADAPHDGGTGMALRLADGTVVRVSDDVAAAGKGFSSSSRATRDGVDSASAVTGPRRTPLRRRTEIFDARTPGAVASIRG